MNANQFFEFICKKKSAKPKKSKEKAFHSSIASLILTETKSDISQGIGEQKERVLPMSIFLQPIV